MGEQLQTSHTATESWVPALSVCRSVSPSLWLLTCARVGARHQVLFLPSVFQLPLSQFWPTSQTNPGHWVAVCSALASLYLFLLVCLPSSATKPRVCLFFLTGDVRAESDAAALLFLSLPPPETDPDDRLGVFCCC